MTDDQPGYKRSGDERSPAQKARDKKNRGTKGHSQPLHHTTDPQLHLKRARKALRDYLAYLKRREVYAKNSQRKSAARARDQDARAWAKELQSTYRKIHKATKND